MPAHSAAQLPLALHLILAFLLNMAALTVAAIGISEFPIFRIATTPCGDVFDA
jgi:hypothetical protein